MNEDERVRVMVDAMYAPEDPPGELVPMHRQILGEVFADKATRAIAALEHAGYYVGRLEEVPPVWCSKHEKTLHPGPDEWGRPWRSEDHDPCPLFRKVVP